MPQRMCHMPRKFEATEEQRKMVRVLAGYGLKQEQIAVLVGIKSTATLRKHFADELVRGPIEAQHNVRRTLYKLATSGRNPGVTMYWLKRWAGWSEQGRRPEPISPDEGGHTWRVTVYQPPRRPEQEQQLQAAPSDADPSTSEWEDWAEDTRPGDVPDRSSRSG
jgi:hypothetical protein